MNDFRASEERAQFQLDLEEALARNGFASVCELLSGRAELESGTFQEIETNKDIKDFRSQVDYIAERLRQEDIEHLEQADIAERLSLLCLARLISASMISTGQLLTAELISTAVKCGYRSINWGLAAAEEIPDRQERFEVQLGLAELRQGPERLLLFERLLSRDLPEMSAGDQSEATESLATALPVELLPQLDRKVEEFARDHVGSYPRSLAAIAAATSEEPERSKLIDKALIAARARPGTWGYAMTVLRVLPLVPEDQRRARWREFISATFDGLGVPGETNFTDLLPLADLDFVKPFVFTDLVNAATKKTDNDDNGRLYPDQRDRLLAEYASRLAASRRVVDAFRVIALIPPGQKRFDAVGDVLAGVGQWLFFAVLALPAPPRSHGQSIGRIVRAGLLLIGPGGRYRLRKRLLSLALTVDDREARQEWIWRLLPYLPADLAQQARNELREILANSDMADPSGRRQVIGAMVNLAEASQDEDRKELLSRAFELIVIGDDVERRIFSAECRRLAGLQALPDRDTLLAAMEPSANDDDRRELGFDAARLPVELLSLAWEAAWASDPYHFRQFGVIADRMAELGLADTAYGRLERLILWLSRERLTELLEGLPPTLLTPRLADCLLARWQQATGEPERGAEDFALELAAVTKIARHLPDEVATMIVDWHRAAQPWPGTSNSSWEDINACLAPLYAQAGYLEDALSMATVMTADREKAQALAGIAGYLPDPDGLATAREALRLTCITGNERVQTDYRRQFGELLARIPGGTRFTDIVADSPDARTLGLIASILPADEAAPVWKNAIKAMSASELTGFVSLMPEDIASDAISAIARHSEGDYYGRQALVVREIFSRLGETSPSVQFDRLVEFLGESALLGRPVLLRQLVIVAPLLLRLGGDGVLIRLSETLDQVAGWWP